jgi:DNA helicase-2/ATP-dependent DNA helicase PcrA
VSEQRIFEGLNPEQCRAVEAVRGPVCILAGAGSGKTTTITHRVANQVATGAFRSDEILAVTFTDKAAGEMRARLERLGVTGVRACTFHSAALGQLRFFAPEPIGKILASKALPLRYIGNSLPRPYRFRPAADLATEVEWAKNRRIAPADYVRSLGDHEPPIPKDLMVKVYRDYERRKADQGYVDFEDLIEMAIRLFDADAGALEQVRDRYRSFTVDEYQDVNLLQQTLLDRWLGEREELCAVGDDYQSIYAFTGASPEHLLTMPTRFPGATVVRLEENYRSTPEVLEFANRLVPRLGGAEKVLRATLPGGDAPVTRSFAEAEDEAAFIVDRIQELHAAGTPYEEMALLIRTNARSADFEEALTDAEIPSQGAALLSRDGARQLLKALRGSGASVSEVRRIALDQGMLEVIPDKLGEREVTRQNDLARLVRLADAFGEGTVAEFIAQLEERFGSNSGKGVHLLTYHRAKGLEFDAVFLPRLEERELPSKLSKTDVAIAEERRLLYVGLTRARRHLTVTWAGKPSRFLAELDIANRATPAAKTVEPDDPLYAVLK